jgi:hypothetical protein
VKNRRRKDKQIKIYNKKITEKLFDTTVNHQKKKHNNRLIGLREKEKSKEKSA